MQLKTTQHGAVDVYVSSFFDQYLTTDIIIKSVHQTHKFHEFPQTVYKTWCSVHKLSGHTDRITDAQPEYAMPPTPFSSWQRHRNLGLNKV